MVNSVTRCGMYTSSLRYTCPIGLLRRPITAVRISIVLNISRHHLLVVHDTKYIQLPRRWAAGEWARTIQPSFQHFQLLAPLRRAGLSSTLTILSLKRLLLQLSPPALRGQHDRLSQTRFCGAFRALCDKAHVLQHSAP